MKPQTKQMALKASLLVVLAANVSWTAKSQLMNAMDLASRDPAASEIGLPGVVPSRTNVRVEDAKPTTPPPSNAPGPKPDAPISSTSISTQDLFENDHSMCGHKYKVHFFKVKDQDRVRAIFSEIVDGAADRQIGSVSDEGTFEELIADKDGNEQPGKARFDAAIEKNLRKAFKCTDDSIASDDAKKTPVDSDDDTKDSKADKIARGLRNCTLDKDGHPLKSAQKFDCNLARLQKISLDTDDQQDDEDAPRHHRSRRSAGLAQVESILRPMKTMIKSLLLSSNEDKQDDGQAYLDDVVSTLEDIRDTASDAKDERALTKMIEGLDKGFVLGAKVDREGDIYQNQLDKLDGTIEDLKAEMNQAPIYLQGQYGAKLQNLMIQRVNLQQQVQANKDYLGLVALGQRGVLDSSDYSDFTASYNALLLQIRGTNGANGSTSITAPSDISTYRGQTPGQTNVGATLPAPSVNYQMLGLPTPSTSPMIPPTVGAPTMFNQTQMPMQSMNQFMQPGMNQFNPSMMPPQQPGFQRPGMPLSMNPPMMPARF